MPVKQNHAGRTFGRITLSAPVPGKSGYWKGRCSCGNPVEKRIDNLKRPGHHSCGKCYPITLDPDAILEDRVRRLEQIVSLVSPGIRATVGPGQEEARTLLSRERGEGINLDHGPAATTQ